MSSKKQGASSILVYSVLRVGLFFAVWLLLQLVTPLRGLWAVAAAILVSGVVSLFLLSRPRTAMGDVVGGFFGRINARIDDAARVEDDSDQHAHYDAHGQPTGVDRNQDAGGGQGRDEVAPDGPASDDPDRSDRPRDSRQPE